MPSQSREDFRTDGSIEISIGDGASRLPGDCSVSHVLSGHSVGQLDLAPQLLVWALRRRRLDGHASGLLAHGFRLTFGLGGVERAISSFEKLFRALERQPHAPLQICCVQCGLLSADEWTILELVRAAGERQSGRLRSLAAILVASPADRQLAEAAAQFARQLATAETLARPSQRRHEAGDPSMSARQGEADSS